MSTYVRTVSLKITNCLDCPYSKSYTSTYTGDSFDMADEDIVCALADGKWKTQDGIVKGQPIVVSERWRIRALCTVPSWCPLLPPSKRKK